MRSGRKSPNAKHLSCLRMMQINSNCNLSSRSNRKKMLPKSNRKKMLPKSTRKKMLPKSSRKKMLPKLARWSRN